MPLVQVFTTQNPEPAARESLLQDLSRLLAQHFRKPESYVMTCLVPSVAMTFAGKPGPTCFVVVRNIGKMTGQTTAAISAELCAKLSSALGVPGDRIYIEFGDAQGHLWGFDGGTFG